VSFMLLPPHLAAKLHRLMDFERRRLLSQELREAYPYSEVAP